MRRIAAETLGPSGRSMTRSLFSLLTIASTLRRVMSPRWIARVRPRISYSRCMRTTITAGRGGNSSSR
jgi:hypothetical protein